MSYDFEEMYNQIVDDVCKKPHPNYNNLVVFLSYLLDKKVKYWCDSNFYLKGTRLYEDVLQDIKMRIIKNCERNFFKQENRDAYQPCDNFKAWCYTVAKNYFCSYLKSYKKKYSIDIDAVSNNKNKAATELDVEQLEKDLEQRKRLNQCFWIVFNLKSKPHIILTWLAVTLFMLSDDASKIESTHKVDRMFCEATLFDMFDYIIRRMTSYDWVELPKSKAEEQREKLSIQNECGKKIGDMVYSDFYMKKGAEMSISDWVNRVNAQIKSKFK